MYEVRLNCDNTVFEIDADRLDIVGTGSGESPYVCLTKDCQYVFVAPFHSVVCVIKRQQFQDL